MTARNYRLSSSETSMWHGSVEERQDNIIHITLQVPRSKRGVAIRSSFSRWNRHVSVAKRRHQGSVELLEGVRRECHIAMSGLAFFLPKCLGHGAAAGIVREC
jgi:hypothetical protein